MGQFYAGKSTFWDYIWEIFDTEDVTNTVLYKYGINRVRDSIVWLYDEIVRRSASLARTQAGTIATLTGSADVRTFTYDPVAGDLNGLTLQVQSDTSSLTTITFGTGGSAPTNPADVVTAINNATSSDPVASIDAAGKLSVSATTSGGGGSVTVAGGTACPVLGFAAPPIGDTGSGSGGDGINLVGGAQIAGLYATIPAGTLRSMLLYIANNLAPAESVLHTSGIIVSNKQTAGDSSSGSCWFEHDDGTSVQSLRTKNNTGSNYFWLLIPAIHGRRLTGVYITTRGDSANPTFPSTPAKYRIYRMTTDNTIQAPLGAEVTDSHDSGNWVPTALEQEVTPTAAAPENIIDLSAYTYHLRIDSPYHASGSQMRVLALRATWDVP